MSTPEETVTDCLPSEPLEDSWDTLNPKPDLVLPRLSDEKLREFIQQFLANEIFTSEHVRAPQDIPMVFMPLIFGALEGYNMNSLNIIGLFYADMSAAMSRSINGYPCFMEVKMLHHLDWARARKVIDQEYARRKELELPPDDVEG